MVIDTPLAEQPFFAVVISSDKADTTEKKFSETLNQRGFDGLKMRKLGESGGFFAFEAILPSMSTRVAAALQNSLSDAIGPAADIAVIAKKDRRKQILICDMDSTIIGQECLDELADFAGLKAEVSAITERAMAGELDFEGALRGRVAMLKGLDLSALQQCYDMRIRLNPGARILVATMRRHGARALLVSGGFTFFTERVANSAGFERHRGNRLLDDGRCLTGAVAEPILGREAKEAALHEVCTEFGLAPNQALAMGDGANDLAMIQASGLGIAFHAKPVVAAAADCAIQATDLRAALFFQGYHADEFTDAMPA